MLPCLSKILFINTVLVCYDTCNLPYSTQKLIIELFIDLFNTGAEITSSNVSNLCIWVIKIAYMGNLSIR